MLRAELLKGKSTVESPPPQPAEVADEDEEFEELFEKALKDRVKELKNQFTATTGIVIN